MAAILTALEPDDVLFIDEIHRLNRAIEELLYPAMEDGCIDIVIGQGPGAHSLRLDLAPLHAGRCHHPHRAADHAAARPVRHHPPARPLPARGDRADRHRSAAHPGCRSTTAACRRSAAARAARRGSPTGCCAACATSRRCATGRDHREVAVAGAGAVRGRRARPGADRPRDPAPIAETFSGGPVGLSTLAVAIGEEADTLEDVYEPYLLQLGLLQRTPRGRVHHAHRLRSPRSAGAGARPAPVLSVAEPYPEIEPHAHGMLEAGHGNRVYWETCGNPAGKPALVLHGGPGSGCTAWHRRLFDPAAYRIVLFDQRGCGRSTPHAGPRHRPERQHDPRPDRRHRGAARAAGHRGLAGVGRIVRLMLALAYAERTRPG